MAAKKAQNVRSVNFVIARRVRRALDRLGLTQRELAVLADVPRSSVDHPSRGHGKIRPEVEETIRALDFQNLEHAGDSYLHEMDEAERVAATEFGAHSELYKRAIYGELALLAGTTLEEAI